MPKIKHQFLIYLLLLISVSAQELVYAQFSPGRLSKYHSKMEGTLNCTECHELGEKEISSGCTDCHSPLNSRIISGLGYHKDLTMSCGECHSEHNGEEFELIYWPDNNIRNFDHEKTGYFLTGKHKILDCEKCHSKEYIKSKDIIAWASENTDFPVLERTFLGLPTLCIGCHNDIHDGEVSLACETCHNAADWKEAITEFDHSKAGFILTGTHITTACSKCHKLDTSRQPQVMQLNGIAFDTCTRCHTAVHGKEVSDNCTACHDAFDWKKPRDLFDHNKAKFILTGAHLKSRCVECHKPEPFGESDVLQLTGFPFDGCFRCHKDIHLGTFGSTCEACHSTGDWKKGLFAFDHNKTKYPLIGKHNPLECSTCHLPEIVGKMPLYDKCVRCHEDKHYGQFNLASDDGDCKKCHSPNGFKLPVFSIADHQASRFTIDGAHLAIPCNLCHTLYEPSTGIFTVQFIWTEFLDLKSVPCASCHDDVHRKQFVTHFNNGCEVCHSSLNFKNALFNHGKADYKLDGKHSSISCEKCHFAEEDNIGKFTIYRPISHKCEDCHKLDG